MKDLGWSEVSDQINKFPDKLHKETIDMLELTSEEDKACKQGCAALAKDPQNTKVYEAHIKKKYAHELIHQGEASRVPPALFSQSGLEARVLLMRVCIGVLGHLEQKRCPCRSSHRFLPSRTSKSVKMESWHPLGPILPHLSSSWCQLGSTCAQDYQKLLQMTPKSLKTALTWPPGISPNNSKITKNRTRWPQDDPKMVPR